MSAIKKIWRKEFTTIRQLEKNLYRIMKPLAIMMGLGVMLCFTIMFLGVGMVVCAVSGVLLITVFIWMIQLQKLPRRDIRCPFCTNVNQVFNSVQEFECDICNRSIVFNEKGVPMPADGSLDDVKPKSIYDL